MASIMPYWIIVTMVLRSPAAISGPASPSRMVGRRRSRSARSQMSAQSPSARAWIDMPAKARIMPSTLVAFAGSTWTMGVDSRRFLRTLLEVPWTCKKSGVEPSGALAAREDDAVVLAIGAQRKDWLLGLWLHR